MAWYFLGQFSRISDGHLYPFYPEVPPPPSSGDQQGQSNSTFDCCRRTLAKITRFMLYISQINGRARHAVTM